jgi:Uma2 family endonuclease
MVQSPAKSLTLDEFLKLPETKPASEYIDGQIIQKPMPQGKHSVIQVEFASAANRKLKPERIAYAFSELRCTFGGKSIVPDIAVFTWDRIPRDENGEVANVFSTAPNWLIEILSPDQSPTKLIIKITQSFEHECVMGWLIDPAEKIVIVFFPNQAPRSFDEPDQVLPVPGFASEFQLTVGELFGWLVE